ncbi:tol-pal system-associated acyl-CoA thioesterase [Aurantimonas sp. VKM B-3413]|uniref:tol-pal system-associated acyl-CoA thioesterase n=1 Tax=Aurantimonas sp. VKM B-3413 TaxID=2779401 RepID=UPI001E2DDB36|nr:tol-pal system-associated acyl-CoA thioesterase [Aurantimonas sp. VKM B-3413]MCB8839273.1 tol-pal system-associated acyl-CoA thioesterase [Aurantimonas sp. VKM B-3413]
MSETISGRLTAAGHELDVRIYFEDTDFSGVVYHARYLHFLERGRSDFLRLKGFDHRALMEGAFGSPMAFAVRHMEIDFLRPARIDDIVTVETRSRLVGGARILLDQTIRRADETLVTAAVKVAVISPEGKPMRMPQGVMSGLAPPDAEAGG